MTISLSLPEARKLALQSQRLYSRHSFGGGVEGALNAIQHPQQRRLTSDRKRLVHR